MSDGFKINKAYAERYNNWRQKEELQKLKQKYGSDEISESSSSSESEDDDAEALTQQVERDWLRALSAIKSKDPKIYKSDVSFFQDAVTDDSEVANGKASKKQKKGDQPMFLKDYERKLILEKDGIVDEDENKPSTSVPRYDEEQEQLRKNIVAAVGSDDSDADSDDGLLKPRQKSTTETQKEEIDYLEWLKGKRESPGEDKEVGIELEPLKEYWQSKNLTESEKFLKNYILNKQYIDKDGELPTYDEIVDEEDELSEDEELLTKQDNFERKYNFRFEEPNAEEIKTFPRNYEETVRKKNTQRADKRKEVQERKKHEKEKKKEELKQMKKMKRNEIMDRIEKLQEITGNKQMAFNEDDLDEEYDPDKHDQMMEKYFDDEYYDEGEGDDAKPVFDMSDDDADTPNWDNWTGAEGNEEWNGDGTGDAVDDPGFCMDADYDPAAASARKKTKKEMKRNKLAQALCAKKPVFDPREKTFEQYFDEYYKLDYEDIIDDMPCRFKYRKVTPNNYGLSVDEIIKSRDKELNAWVSVKKMSQYRTEDEEQQDVRVFSAKGRNPKKKQNVLTSLFESGDKDDKKDATSIKIDSSETAGEQTGKSKRKRKNRKKKPTKANTNNSQDSGVGSVGDSEDVKSVKSPTHENQSDKTALTSVSPSSRDNDKPNASTDKVSGKSKKKQKKEKMADGLAESNVNAKKATKRKLTDQVEGTSKKQKVKGNNDSSVTEEHANVTSIESDGVKVKATGNKQDKKQKKKHRKANEKMQMSDERLKAYGINPKKYKYMKKEELFQMKPRNKE